MVNIMKHFDELVALAQQDPERFDRRKAEIIEEYFKTLPPEKAEKARQFQWRLDAELSQRPGIDRYNAMVVKFWNGFAAFNAALNGKLPDNKPPTESNVVPFKHK